MHHFEASIKKISLRLRVNKSAHPVLDPVHPGSCRALTTSSYPGETLHWSKMVCQNVSRTKGASEIRNDNDNTNDNGNANSMHGASKNVRAQARTGSGVLVYHTDCITVTVKYVRTLSLSTYV